MTSNSKDNNSIKIACKSADNTLIDRALSFCICNGNHVYAIGGCDRFGTAFNSVHSLNLEGASGSQWNELPSLPETKAATNGLCIEDRIYTFGGICGANVQVSSTECFNISTQIWTPLTPLSKPTQGIALSMRNGKIIGVGGVTDSFEAMNTLFCFDPNTHKFANLPQMPTPRYQCALTYHSDRDCLYVLGGRVGRNASKACEAFEFRTLSWRTLTENESNKRVFVNHIRVNNKLFVIGGLDESVKNGFSKTVDVFDIDKETWSLGPPLVKARGDSYITSIDGHILIAGGFGEKGVESSVDTLDVRKLDSESADASASLNWVNHDVCKNAHATASYCAFENSLLLLGGMLPTGLSNKVDILYRA